MFTEQKLIEARNKAATFASKLKEVQGDKSVEESVWRDVVVKLTEANQEVERLNALKTEQDKAEQIAARYLEPDESRRIHAKGPETETNEKRQAFLRGVHKDAAVAYIRSGGDIYAARDLAQARGATPNEIATMVTGDARKGGILVPPEWLAARDTRQMPAVMRGMCDVVTTSSDVVTVPLIEGSLETPNMVAEGTEHTTRQDVDLGGVDIKVNDWHPKPVVVSQKLLRNQGANIDQIIGNRIIRRLDLDEDQQFLNGTGVGEAYGLLREDLAHVVSQNATAITYEGLVNLLFDDVNGIGEEWSVGAANIMRRATYANILTVQDPAGHYVFGLANQVAANTLLGEPVKFSSQMPEVEADAYPIVRGWFPAYTIVDGAGGMSIKRLEEKFDPNVGFSVLKLFGGRTVQTEAFVRLKIAAS